MRLCDRDIEAWLDEGRLAINPRPPVERINGATVDVRLGNKFRTFRGHTAPFIDLSGPKAEVSAALDRVMSEEIVLPEGEAFFLHPGELALAVTYESVTLPADLVGWLDGRSSLARLGLMVHVTAHRIDAAGPAWIDTVRGHVYHQSQSGQRRTAVKPADEVRRQGDGFKRYRQRQFTRMQIKGFAIFDYDFVTHHAIERGADFVLRSAEVNERCGMAAKGAEFIPQPDIDGHPIDTLNRWTWGNRQTAFIQPGFNIAITKTHAFFSFHASYPEPVSAQGKTRLSLNGTQFTRLIQKTG